MLKISNNSKTIYLIVSLYLSNHIQKRNSFSLSSEYPQNATWPNRGSLLQNWSSEVFLRSLDRPDFSVERLLKLFLCHWNENIAESDDNSSLELVQEGLEADHITVTGRESHDDDHDDHDDTRRERPLHSHSWPEPLDKALYNEIFAIFGLQLSTLFRWHIWFSIS